MAADKNPSVTMNTSVDSLAVSSSSEQAQPMEEKFVEQSGLKLETQTLDEWVKMVTATQSETDERPTVNLSRFGLKNPEDVKAFLKSPAGDSLQAELGEEIALQRAIEENLKFEEREHNIFMHRLRAALFLWFLKDDARAERVVHELIEAQNAKAIKAATGKTAEPKTELANHQAELKKAIADYDTGIRLNEAALEQLNTKGMTLAEKILALEKHGALIDFKHDLYEKALARFDKIAEEQAVLEKHIETVDNQIHVLAKQIQVLLDSPHDVDENLEKAMALKEEINALNLQLGSYSDLLDVKKSLKYYADEQGEPVNSAKDAHFVVNRNQKIVKKDNEYYLLNANEHLDSLSIERQHEAKKLFAKERSALMSVKKVVEDNKGLEKADHRERLEEVHQQVAQNGDDKRHVQNQATLLHAGRSVAQNRLDQSDLEMQTTPVPRVTPTPIASKSSSTAPKPSPVSVTAVYERLINKKGPIMRDELRLLMESLKNAGNNAASLYLNSIIRLMPGNTPIPQQMMTSLLQNMARFGLNATKPSVTPIKNPLDLNTPPRQVNTAPTPFNMDPFKRK